MGGGAAGPDWEPGPLITPGEGSVDRYFSREQERDGGRENPGEGAEKERRREGSGERNRREARPGVSCEGAAERARVREGRGSRELLGRETEGGAE